jgi:hypothetical protein
MNSLDDLIGATRDVMAARFPDAEYAAIIIHRPRVPDTVIPITPRPAVEQPVQLWPSVHPVS